MHKQRKLDGTLSSRNILGVRVYESFYMNENEYLDDIHYTEEIYKYFNLSELKINHACQWGKYYWVKHFLLKNEKCKTSYREICEISKKTELAVRRILYDYINECKKVDTQVK